MYTLRDLCQIRTHLLHSPTKLVEVLQRNYCYSVKKCSKSVAGIQSSKCKGDKKWGSTIWCEEEAQEQKLVWSHEEAQKGDISWIHWKKWRWRDTGNWEESRKSQGFVYRMTRESCVLNFITTLSVSRDYMLDQTFVYIQSYSILWWNYMQQWRINHISALCHQL